MTSSLEQARRRRQLNQQIRALIAVRKALLPEPGRRAPVPAVGEPESSSAA